MNYKFVINEDESLTFNDEKQQLFYDSIVNIFGLNDYLCDWNEEDWEDFLSEQKRYFVWNPGPGDDSDAHIFDSNEYYFFDSEDEMSEFFKKKYIYNEENVFVFDIQESKQLKIDQRFYFKEI